MKKYTKCTEEQQSNIIALKKEGKSYSEIYRITGIPQSTLYNICSRHGITGTKHMKGKYGHKETPKFTIRKAQNKLSSSKLSEAAEIVKEEALNTLLKGDKDEASRLATIYNYLESVS